MLYYVSGNVALLEPGLAVIDCGGVGYGCRITAYTAAQLKVGKSTRLFITESIREDAYDLYGVATREEQRCFTLLTGVTGSISFDENGDTKKDTAFIKEMADGAFKFLGTQKTDGSFNAVK